MAMVQPVITLQDIACLGYSLASDKHLEGEAGLEYVEESFISGFDNMLPVYFSIMQQPGVAESDGQRHRKWNDEYDRQRNGRSRNTKEINRHKWEPQDDCSERWLA